ncbi:hypothetical protein DV515_00019371 [Chloebia gouldiae]|uniref:SH3 domain-containing protein n=1 Tax=Chloebia gouldiae TaxID=44316 RepID=A0A3L8Q510_CHLGU|nr:hypothetical protein DV515_00019371 [Chloebia gouldiae]
MAGDLLQIVNQDDPNWWQACHVEGGSAGLVPSQLLEEKRKAFVKRDGEVAPSSGTGTAARPRGTRLGGAGDGRDTSVPRGSTAGPLRPVTVSPSPQGPVPLALSRRKSPILRVMSPRRCPCGRCQLPCPLSPCRGAALSLSPSLSPAQPAPCPARGPVWQPQREEEEEDDVPDDEERR